MNSSNPPKPPQLPAKPEREKDFAEPVAWLLGAQLIASLKWIALYAAYKGKLDPRDWMNAAVHDFTDQPRGNQQISQGEYWFDYLSDTGDGQKAMYSLACLCLSDLSFDESSGAVHTVGAKPQSGETLLPRGEFLFVGGDTSYHIADYPTLAKQFQAPFAWAYADLKNQGFLKDEARRPLFGLPGNHDYYDGIDGFNRQFRKPTSAEDQANHENLYPLLSIPGFRRCQNASYTALRLPFDWWLWGLDDEIGRLDIRQQEFFKKLTNGQTPAKLIVATAEPTTVSGRRAKADDKTPGVFKDLCLPMPFLDEANGQPSPAPKKVLPENVCRVDLSGDMHNYQRYWGETVRAQDGNAQAPSACDYASVVSGLGGAFLHPSHTDFGEVKSQEVFPKAKVSRIKMAWRIFNPWNVYRGGYVHWFGAAIAAVWFLASRVSQSSKVVVDALLKPFNVPAYPQVKIAELLPPLQNLSLGFMHDTKLTGFSIAWHITLLVLSLLAIIASNICFKRMLDLRRNEQQKESRYRRIIGALIPVSLGCLLLGMADFVEHREKLSPFESSLLILFVFLWAAAALVASAFYSERIFKRTYEEPQSKLEKFLAWLGYWPVGTLIVVALAVMGCGIYFFGKYPAAYLLSDLIFIFVILATVLGIILLAIFAGGGMHKASGKIGFAILGIWHALLQIATAFLLVRVGSSWAWLIALASVPVFMVIGNLLMTLNSRWVMLVAWVAYGGLLLGLPFGFRETASPPTATGALVLQLLVAGLFGALWSCVWLGWYLVVATEFNGHYSEAGGAARVEEFKQFIRFRVRENDLTGYVIAIEKPEIHGEDLRPKIIDTFQVKVC